MSPFVRLAAGLASVLMLGSACAGGDDSDSGSGATTTSGGGAGGEAAAVAVKDDLFDPDEVTVATGGTVTWTWEGNNPHNVNGDDFDSEIQSDGTFEHTFEEAGTFDYVCTVHPSMEASVVVTEQ